MYTEIIQKEALVEGMKKGGQSSYNKGKNDGISQGIEQSFVSLIGNGIQMDNVFQLLNIPSKDYDYYRKKYGSDFHS